MHRQLIAGLFILGALAGCRADDAGIGETEDGQLAVGQSEVRETSVRGINPGTRTLVISGFTGNIMLTGSDEPNARLEFTKRARGADDEAARRLLPEMNVDESGTDETYGFTMQSSRPGQSAIDVRGTVPSGTPVRIQMEAGTIELSALDGPLDVSTQHGSIRVAGVGRPLTVETGNGDIEVGMRMVPPDGQINVTTSNGDILLALPSSASAQVDAQTSAGSISVRGLSFTSRGLEPRGAGARFSGQIGQGNAAITLRTQNGSVTIQEGRIVTLPADDTLVGSPGEAVRGDTTLDRTLAPPDTLQEVDPATQDTSVLRE